MRSLEDEDNFCIIASMGAFLGNFLALHSEILHKNGCLDLICCDGRVDLTIGIPGNVSCIPLDRRPTPLRDLFFLIKLVRRFRQKKYKLIIMCTPKVSFLASLAAYICCVPIRINIFTGQVWSTHKGFSRWLLKFCDHVTAKAATSTLVDSPSQLSFLQNEGVLEVKSGRVLGSGSICGVDVKRFKFNLKFRREVRSRLALTDEDFVLLYVGRITTEKGVKDLVRAFSAVSQACDDLKLVILGSEEDVSKSDLLTLAGGCSDKITFCEYSNTPEHFYFAADLLCLPSYREGFGQVIIEAAASRLPTLESNIYGIVDAINENETGLLFQPGNVEDLSNKIYWALDNRKLLRKFGLRGEKRAHAKFAKTLFFKWLDTYLAGELRSLK